MWEVACCLDVLSQVLQRKTMAKRINGLWSQTVGSECPLWTILYLTIGVNFFLIQFLTILQMQIFFYNPDDFDSFQTAISENRIIGAMAIFFQVS